MDKIVEVFNGVSGTMTGKVAIMAAGLSIVAIGWCALITRRRYLELNRRKCVHAHLMISTFKSLLSGRSYCKDCGKKFIDRDIPGHQISEIRKVMLDREKG